MLTLTDIYRMNPHSGHVLRKLGRILWSGKAGELPLRRDLAGIGFICMYPGRANLGHTKR